MPMNGQHFLSDVWTSGIGSALTSTNASLCGSSEGTPLSRHASVNSVEMIVIAEDGSHVFR